MKCYFAAILGILLLLVSVTSCGNINPTAEQVSFDSLTVDTICPLFKNYEKPACHIRVKLSYPQAESQTAFCRAFEQFLSDVDVSGSILGEYDSFDELVHDYVHNYILDYLNEGPAAIDNYGEDIDAASNWMSYEELIDGTVLYNADYFISYMLKSYSYTGGAHGNLDTSLGVFNLKNNMRITLADICDMTKQDELNQLLRDRLVTMNDCETMEELVEKEIFFDPTEIEATDKFYVNENGICWLFDQYEIAPMSAGEVIIPISWDEIKPLIDEMSPLADMVAKYTAS